MPCLSLSDLQKSWIERLCSEEWNQSHLLDKADDEEGLKRLISQLEALDSAYPGGLLGYIKRARRLLADSRDGVSLLRGCVPSVPSGEVLVTGSSEYNEFEKSGLANVHKVAFVLVAGGLGERLGYPGIKIGLPIETCTGMTYIEYYIRMILECEHYAEEQTGRRPKLPLAIMTSADTHELTVELLRNHEYFGLPEDQLTLMMQQKVPSLRDNDARFATTANDRYEIETKPHGHGDIHILLSQYGLPRKWLADGLEWLVAFQDTNGLVSHAICPMLGVSIKEQFVLNSLVVPRRVGEAVGAICKLEKPGCSDSLTINVEYNQLNPLLADSGLGSDQPDPITGMSRFPGNTNTLLFHLPRYSAILDLRGGAISEFVNPKYKDDTKTVFKTPTRLECLMQEFPRLFEKNDRVGTTQLDRWLCYSPVKNEVADAAAKSKSGAFSDSAFSGESDQYFCYSKLLSLAASQQGEVSIAPPVDASFLGVDYRLGPKIVMYPSFAITLEQVKRRLKEGPIKIAQGSSLILEGDVIIDGLDVDGAAVLRASKGKKLFVKNLRVRNKGWEATKLEDGSSSAVSPQIAIRGFEIRKHEQTELLAM